MYYENAGELCSRTSSTTEENGGSIWGQKHGEVGGFSCITYDFNGFKVTNIENYWSTDKAYLNQMKITIESAKFEQLEQGTLKYVLADGPQTVYPQNLDTALTSSNQEVESFSFSNNGSDRFFGFEAQAKKDSARLEKLDILTYNPDELWAARNNLEDNEALSEQTR